MAKVSGNNEEIKRVISLDVWKWFHLKIFNERVLLNKKDGYNSKKFPRQPR